MTKIPKTEAAIMEAIERLIRGRTAFIIAHRPSTLESCDVKLQLEEGRVARFSPQRGEGRESPRPVKGNGWG